METNNKHVTQIKDRETAKIKDALKLHYGPNSDFEVDIYVSASHYRPDTCNIYVQVKCIGKKNCITSNLFETMQYLGYKFAIAVNSNNRVGVSFEQDFTVPVVV